MFETTAQRRRSAVGALCLVVVLAACASNPKRVAPTTTSRRRSSTTTTTTTAAQSEAVLAGPLLPMYPFQTLAEATAWRSEHGRTGANGQYLDPGATALAFAHFLGYTEVDRVIATRMAADGAHITVGSLVPDTDQSSNAAIVHLVRYMAGSDAPWEVVGTDDTDFAIQVPGYGARITSPLSVHGRISGVDESIKIHVQQLHANGYLGEFCCVPGGGQDSPWDAVVNYAAPSDQVLIVSASTGGHVRNVERFTANGVRSG